MKKFEQGVGGLLLFSSILGLSNGIMANAAGTSTNLKNLFSNNLGKIGRAVASAVMKPFYFLKGQVFNGTFDDNTRWLKIALYKREENKEITEKNTKLADDKKEKLMNDETAEEKYKEKIKETSDFKTEREKFFDSIPCTEVKTKGKGTCYFWGDNLSEKEKEKNKEKTLVLAFHGQYGVAKKALDMCGIADINENEKCQKVGVASVTYRGYGSTSETQDEEKQKNFENISEQSIYEDVENLVDEAYGRGYRNIYIYGLSLGGAAATRAAEYITTKYSGAENLEKINLQGIILDTVICGTKNSGKHLMEFNSRRNNIVTRTLAKTVGALFGWISSFFWQLDPVANLSRMSKEAKRNVPILYITGDEELDFFNHKITGLEKKLKNAGLNVIGVVEAKGKEHGDQKELENIIKIESNGKLSFNKPTEENKYKCILWGKNKNYQALS